MTSLFRHAFRRMFPTVLLVTTALVVAGRPADAQTLVNCVGTEITTYSPGLLLTPQMTTRHSDTIFSPCVSSDPSIVAGTVSETASTTLSCLALLGGPPGAITTLITWNTGDTSAWHNIVNVQSLGGELIVLQTGTIVSGPFTGATAVGLTTLTAPPVIPCLAPPGLTRLVGAVTLTIVGTH